MVALTGCTRGPVLSVRYRCARPDRRGLRVDEGGWEPGPNFHGSRCGRRRCDNSDHDHRLTVIIVLTWVRLPRTVGSVVSLSSRRAVLM